MKISLKQLEKMAKPTALQQRNRSRCRRRRQIS